MRLVASPTFMFWVVCSLHRDISAAFPWLIVMQVYSGLPCFLLFLCSGLKVNENIWWGFRSVMHISSGQGLVTLCVVRTRRVIIWGECRVIFPFWSFSSEAVLAVEKFISHFILIPLTNHLMIKPS